MAGVSIVFLVAVAGVVVMTLLGFLAVFGLLGWTARRSYQQWNENRQQPIATRSARAVSRRAQVSGHHHASTWYYVTFEFDGGERREFSLSGAEYGLVADGDEGTLTFQGTWFKGFERQAVSLPPVLVGKS